MVALAHLAPLSVLVQTIDKALLLQVVAAATGKSRPQVQIACDIDRRKFAARTFAASSFFKCTGLAHQAARRSKSDVTSGRSSRSGINEYPSIVPSAWHVQAPCMCQCMCVYVYIYIYIYNIYTHTLMKGWGFSTRLLMLTFPLGVFVPGFGGLQFRAEGTKANNNYLTRHTRFFFTSWIRDYGRRNGRIFKEAKNNLTGRTRFFATWVGGSNKAEGTKE